MKHFKTMHSHFKHHHKKYLLGIFGSFAVVKMVVVFAGLFGLVHLGSTFAQAPVELNSGNLTSLGCPPATTECDLSNQNIISIAPDTFINHTGFVILNLGGNQLTSIDSGDFNGLSNLQELALYSNQITGIETNSFVGLDILPYLDLGSNQITSIESGDFNGLSGVTTLVLEYNNITSIDSGDFNGLSDNINYLGLGVNSIASIDESIFLGFPNLASFYFNDNLLTSLPDSFLGLGNIVGGSATNNCLVINQPSALQSYLTGHGVSYDPQNTGCGGAITFNLDASFCSGVTAVPENECIALVALYSGTDGAHRTNKSNRGNTGSICTNWNGIACVGGHISSISLGSNYLSGALPVGMGDLPYVDYMDLSSNQITSIDSGAFLGMSALAGLYLGPNLITSLDSGDFYGLSGLIQLDLGWNLITSIESGAFNGLDSLQYFDLNNNQISSLDSGDFNGLSNLTQLNLKSNQMTSIDSGDFDGLSANVTNLNISVNSITSIDESIFLGFPGLTQLRLDSNSLTTLPDSFLGLNSLNAGYVTNNCLVINQPSALQSFLSGHHITYAPQNTGCGGAITFNLDASFCSGVTAVPENECIALVALYSGTDGAHRTNKSNRGNTGSICTNWYGITCAGGHISQVNLGTNYLSGALPVGMSDLPYVTYMDLSVNLITSIDTGAFLGFSALTGLDLHSDLLTSLDSGDFLGLTSLENLYLNSNVITGVQNGDFAGLPSLITLNLASNQISSIDASTFNGLSNLIQLDFFNNQLSSLESGDFDGLNSLMNLSLYSNDITSIESGDFSGPQSLSALNLSSNQITGVENGDFLGLSDLSNLDLGSNQITSIDSGDFNGLSGLIQLHLESNLITSIDNSIFLGIPNLVYFYFNNNLLTSLPSSFTGLGSIAQGNATNNCLVIDQPSALQIYLTGHGVSYAPQNTGCGGSIHMIYSAETCSGVTEIPESECIALIALYNSTDGDNRSTKDYRGNMSAICDTRYGVSCDMNSHVSTISIPSNNLSGFIPTEVTDLIYLNSLDFHTNSITFIETGALNGLSGLTYLNLGSNQISSLETNVFSGLSIVATLGLGSNQITSIDSGDLNGLTLNLTTLMFGGNQITSLETDVFSRLTGLTYLALGGNQITSIESGTFNGLSGVTYLDLTSNQISSIDSSDLNGLSGLQALDLSHNQITSFVGDAVDSFTDLWELYLGWNQITSFESGAFDALPHLDPLDLQFSCNTIGYEAIAYPGSTTATDNDGCIAISGTDAAGFITNLESKGYSQTGDYEVGTGALSFNYPGISNQLLAPVIMQSNNPNNYAQAYYQNKVEVQYESGTEITYSGAVFTGVLHSPFLFATGNVPGITGGAISLMRFGALTHRIDFGQAVTIRMPALGVSIGDDVGIYSSDEENIYGSNGPHWSFEQNVTVIDRSGVPYVEFTTTHASRYVLGEPVPDTTAPIGTIDYSPASGATTATDVIATLSLNESGTVTSIGGATHTFIANGSFVFEFQDTAGNTGSATATVTWIDRSTPGGGNGGGSILVHDICPEQRDCSSSYYDNLCGPCPTTGNVSTTGTVHGSASCDVSNSPYTTEFTQAFSYAYDIGATTKCPIATASLTSEITRGQFAKMISEFAKELGKVTDPKLSCKFNDVGSQSKEMQFYITTACQYKLMGRESDGKITKKEFRPNSNLTRAEIATVISRLLYGNKYNTTDAVNRAVKHLQALNTAKIINDISTPNKEEIRVYVMIMLQRVSAEKK